MARERFSQVDSAVKLSESFGSFFLKQTKPLRETEVCGERARLEANKCSGERATRRQRQRKREARAERGRDGERERALVGGRVRARECSI